MIDNKIKSVIALKKLLLPLKKRGKRIIFTNGCFDILHYGHVKYLQDAKKRGDILVVAVNSDSSVRKLKGRSRPVVGQKDRMRVLAALESVDFVTLFSEDTPLKLIELLRPDVLVKGGDWDKKQIVGSGLVESWGGKVISLPFVKSRSTTNIIDKIGKKSADLKGIHRILDANLNRAAEGLRVCEEISRFILNDPGLSESLKDMRHQVNRKLKKFLSAGGSLIEARDSKADVGRAIHGAELERKNVGDIFFANIQRAKESVRVLEEFSKLLNIKRALDFKEIRYEIYGIEKSIAKKMRALRHSR